MFSVGINYVSEEVCYKLVGMIHELQMVSISDKTKLEQNSHKILREFCDFQTVRLLRKKQKLRN